MIKPVLLAMVVGYVLLRFRCAASDIHEGSGK
jgi:hypothetical protein